MNEAVTTHNSKKTTFQFLLIVLLAIAIAACSFIPSIFFYQYYLVRALQLFAFYGLGSFSLNAKRKRSSEEDAFQLAPIIKLSLIILVSLFLLYFFIDNHQMMMSLSCWSSFLLPSILFQGGKVFSEIPGKEYKVWYPEDESISKKAIVFVNSISVKFKYVPGSDNRYRIFETVVPTQMTLGKTFQAFLIQQDDYNYKDENNETEYIIAWQFCQRSFLGLNSRPLDPYLNIWENNIKPNSLINAKRVTVTRKDTIKKLQTTSNADT